MSLPRTYTGRLTRDPIEKETPAGPVVNFGIAENEGYGEDATVKFYDVAIWNSGLRAKALTLGRGHTVSITGRCTEKPSNDPAKPFRNLTADQVGIVTWFTRSADERGQQPQQAPVQTEAEEWVAPF